MSDELNPVDAPVVPPADAPVETPTDAPVVPPADPVTPPAEAPVEAPVTPDATPVVAPAPEPVHIEEPMLSVDVAFDDGQIALISAAGLEPAQVRNEIGLVVIQKEAPQVVDEKRLTLTEAIARAKVRYEK